VITCRSQIHHSTRALVFFIFVAIVHHIHSGRVTGLTGGRCFLTHRQLQPLLLEESLVLPVATTSSPTANFNHSFRESHWSYQWLLLPCPPPTSIILPGESLVLPVATASYLQGVAPELPVLSVDTTHKAS
jgi:hypothetical protein